MSRYKEYDDYDGSPEQILAAGRWERNARAALKSKRGRKALAALREALLALPEKRLVSGALCTTGDPLARYPEVTDEEAAAEHARAVGLYVSTGAGPEEAARWADQSVRWMRERRDEERAAFTEVAGREGAGVCALGAYAWYLKVRDGADPEEAFASLPSLTGDEDSDALSETAEIGKEAGMAYTLAWELAYRNDEIFKAKTRDEPYTPEDRYTAFLAWIDSQLAPEAVSVSG